MNTNYGYDSYNYDLYNYDLYNINNNVFLTSNSSKEDLKKSFPEETQKMLSNQITQYNDSKKDEDFLDKYFFSKSEEIDFDSIAQSRVSKKDDNFGNKSKKTEYYNGEIASNNEEFIENNFNKNNSIYHLENNKNKNSTKKRELEISEIKTKK